jgi:hypothetical protein
MTMTIENTTTEVATDLNVAEGTTPATEKTVETTEVVATPVVETAEVVETTTPVVAETVAESLLADAEIVVDAAPVETPVIADAPKGKGEHKANRKPVNKPKREVPPTQLVDGQEVAGKDCVVMTWFDRKPNLMLVEIKVADGTERVMVRADGLRLDNAGALKDHESRRAACNEKLVAMRTGKIALPETFVTVVEGTEARFIDKAFAIKRASDAQKRNGRLARAANIKAIRELVGKNAANVLVIKKHMGTFKDRETGVERPSLQAVWVRVLGEDGNDVQAYLHISQINGGRMRANKWEEGKTVLPLVRIQEVVDHPHRRDDVKVTVSETETFPFAVGDVFRGAEWDGRREFHDSYVLTLKDYDLHLPHASCYISRELLERAVGKLKFVGFDRGRIMVEKVKA